MYTNQVGGTACLHPLAEGVYVPLFDEHLDLSIFNNFDGYGVLDEEMLCLVENKILSIEKFSFIKINRSIESYEAWIQVKLQEPIWPRGMPELSLIAGFGNCKGILTWPNSD